MSHLLRSLLWAVSCTEWDQWIADEISKGRFWLSLKHLNHKRLNLKLLCVPGAVGNLHGWPFTQPTSTLRSRTVTHTCPAEAGANTGTVRVGARFPLRPCSKMSIHRQIPHLETNTTERLTWGPTVASYHLLILQYMEVQPSAANNKNLR